MSKKVLFISFFEGSIMGGSEFLWPKIAEEFCLNGYATSIIQNEGFPGSPLNHSKLELFKFRLTKHETLKLSFLDRALKKVRQLKGEVFYSDKLEKIIYTISPDLIVINIPDPYIIAKRSDLISFIKDKLGKQIALFVHSYNENYFPSDWQALQKLYSKIDALYFVSEHQKKVLERQFILKLDHGRLFTNPVNLETIEPLPFPKDEKMAFAMVGNFFLEAKGHDLAFQALSETYRHKEDWVLNLYGEGMKKDYLVELANYYGIKNRIVFHGKVNNLKEVWRKNHFLLSTSRIEGLPLSLIEAMACGRPAIATNVGDVAKYVNDETGYLIPFPSVYDITTGLEKMWSDRSKLEQKGKNAFNKVSRQYDFFPQKALYRELQSFLND